MRKTFTEEEIKVLSANPNVKEVQPYRLTLQLEFRKELYDAWVKDPRRQTLIDLLEDNGFDMEMISNSFLSGIEQSFAYGPPSKGRVQIRTSNSPMSEEDNEYLLETGKFVKVTRGIGFEPSFREELRQKYPEQSIEEGLRLAGIDPKRVGYRRISDLMRSFEREKASDEAPEDQVEDGPTQADSSEPDREAVSTSAEDAQSRKTTDDKQLHATTVEKIGFTGHNGSSAEKAEGRKEPVFSYAAGSAPGQRIRCRDLLSYAGNPYVETFRSDGCMSEAFYNEASDLVFLDIEGIFGIYGISAKDLPVQYLKRVYRDLLSWQKTDRKVSVVNAEICRIQKARMTAVEEEVRKNFEETRALLPELSYSEKKALCQAVNQYPVAPEYGYTREYIISQCGFSKSQFYKILRDETYGLHEELQEEQDEKDVELIRKVIAYRGFRKGVRQVYMQLPRVTGAHFALSKVRRLMRKYNLMSGIRSPKNEKKAARERRDRFEKPNLLRRRFRLHRPLEVRLTDVTYIDYGYNPETRKPYRAYGSSSIDPVTGRCLAFNLSRNNDLPLAMSTLAKLSEYPMIENALLHSDHGVLYLTEEFQSKVAELKMKQSMSRIGNCWDNASQESFFGLFKHETKCEECTNYNELEDLVNRYFAYFNEERPKWDRNRMTPIEYEEYLNGLSEEEFAAYLAKEEARYQEMQEKAREKAIEKAKREKGQLGPDPEAPVDGDRKGGNDGDKDNGGDESGINNGSET